MSLEISHYIFKSDYFFDLKAHQLALYLSDHSIHDHKIIDNFKPLFKKHSKATGNVNFRSIGLHILSDLLDKKSYTSFDIVDLPYQGNTFKVRMPHYHIRWGEGDMEIKPSEFVERLYSNTKVCLMLEVLEKLWLKKTSMTDITGKQMKFRDFLMLKFGMVSKHECSLDKKIYWEKMFNLESDTNIHIWPQGYGIGHPDDKDMYVPGWRVSIKEGENHYDFHYTTSSLFGNEDAKNVNEILNGLEISTSENWFKWKIFL